MAFSGTNTSVALNQNDISHVQMPQQKIKLSFVILSERNRLFISGGNFEFIKVKTNDNFAFAVYDESKSRNTQKQLNRKSSTSS